MRNYDTSKNYTGAELESLIKDIQEEAATGTRSRMEKDIEKKYVTKEAYDAKHNEYTALQTTYKTEKFNSAFKDVATKYKVQEKKLDYIKTLGGIGLDDTAEAIENKIKKVKADLPELFNYSEVKMLDSNKSNANQQTEEELSQEDILNPRR